jgi:hypothetical protein
MNLPQKVDDSSSPAPLMNEDQHRPGLGDLALDTVKTHRRGSLTDSTVVGTPAEGEEEEKSINDQEHMNKIKVRDVVPGQSGKKPLTGIRLVLLMVAMVSVFSFLLARKTGISSTHSRKSPFLLLCQISC